MSNRICHFKLVLLGDTAVGKSCLVVRFVRDEFFEFQEPTIGAAFLTQTVALDDATVKFEIWDTAGQERYRSLGKMISIEKVKIHRLFALFCHKQR
mmetsp:Transcript_178/g.156  ORF Transcript_178/g.156 Transcript_178/m.156 type:complete len:96 (+) Transcript_178:95-382(+)